MTAIQDDGQVPTTTQTRANLKYLETQTREIDDLESVKNSICQ